ncbi:MAG: hypothetical protein ACLPY5_07050 [Candidatus Bathyarchaeia archaeon]
MDWADGTKSIAGLVIVIFGLVACCLFPLLAVGGVLVILSFFAPKNVLFALVAVLVLAVAFYAAYWRRKKNRGICQS